MAKDDFQAILVVVLDRAMETGRFRRLSEQDEAELIEYVVELNQKVFDRRIQMLRDAGVIP